MIRSATPQAFLAFRHSAAVDTMPSLHGSEPLDAPLRRPLRALLRRCAGPACHFSSLARPTPLNRTTCGSNVSSLPEDGASDASEFCPTPVPPGDLRLVRAESGAGRPRSWLRRDLKISVGDAIGFSVMVGVGETYFAAFALAIGVGEIAAGLVATAPLLLGAFLQWTTPWAVARVGTHRRWVVLCAGLQAAAFLPLIAAAIAGHLHVAVLYAVVALYWGAGMATAPAWNTWMGRVVPVNIRARYFSLRTRLGQVCVLLGFLVGGLGLQWASAHDAALAAFAGLFALAAAARTMSTVCLARQYEPVSPVTHEEKVPLGELARRIQHAGDGRLIVYLLAVQVTVQIAGPFFTPFMLKQIQFTYGQYVALASCAFVGKVLALAPLGRVAQRYGAQRLLAIGGLGICPLSALWLISNDFTWLMFVQAFGGAAWAAYELAMFLLWFESVAEHERTSVQTTHNFAHALATCAGSLIGGTLLWTLGQHPGAYLTVFALSAAARLATLPLLARVPGAFGSPRVLVGRVRGEGATLPAVVSADEESWSTSKAA